MDNTWLRGVVEFLFFSLPFLGLCLIMLPGIKSTAFSVWCDRWYRVIWGVCAALFLVANLLWWSVTPGRLCWIAAMLLALTATIGIRRSRREVVRDFWILVCGASMVLYVAAILGIPGDRGVSLAPERPEPPAHHGMIK